MTSNTFRCLVVLTVMFTAALWSAGCGWRGGERMPGARGGNPAPVAAGLRRMEAQQALARGTLLAEQGLDDIALGEFERAIAINPELAPAYVGIAEILHRRGDLVPAEAHYAKAATLEPRNFRAQFGHGQVLQLLGRLAEAVRAYLKALAIAPNDPQANLAVATAYLQLGEPGTALAYAQRAVRLDPGSGPARVNLGAVYAALNEHARAVVEYQQAAELMELSPELLLNLADSLGRLRRFAEMQNVLEQLIRAAPSPAAYERLATALFRQERYDDALAMFRTALELDPDYYPALNGVGVCLLNRYLLSDRTDMEAREQAVRALRRSLQIQPRQPAVVDLLARYG